MITFSRPITLLIFVTLLGISLSGWLSLSLCLLLGILYAVVINNLFIQQCSQAAPFLLKTCIVLLGFSLNIKQVGEVVEESFILVVSVIAFAFAFGLLLGKAFKVDNKLSFLVVGGSAICGGSAIAALAPSINAKHSQLVIAMSIVFVLNSIGLLLFPYLAVWLNLDPESFGVWSALALHDTSSVIAAASSYNEASVQIATTTKLSRALWIFPLVFIAAFCFKQPSQSAKFPLFIVFFVIASLAASFITPIQNYAGYAPVIVKKMMALTLFLVGTSINKESLKQIQAAAFFQAVILWLALSIFSFGLVFWLD
jgi:uncharacterized integral membrane protein (TIGR00698 family)